MEVEHPALRRSLGLRTIVSTSAGLTFASAGFLMVVMIGNKMPGDAAWIAILIAGALCMLAAAAFSELNGMYPTALGVQLYIRRAFGEKLSLVAALTYMTVVAMVVGTEAYVLSHVLSAAVPQITPPVWIFLMLTLATAANYRGIKVAGNLQDFITYSVITSIVLMSVFALAHVNFHIPQPLHTGGPDHIFNAVALAVFLYVGFEWVTPLAEEVKEPKSIPYGMFVALGVLAIVYSLITTTMFATAPRDLMTGIGSREPVPHLVFASAALGPAGRWVMIITSLLMSLTTFNAGLIGMSRFVYAMARENVLPKKLSHISSRYSTPDAAVLAIYTVAMVVSYVVWATQKFMVLANLAAAGESFIYAFAAASVIALRRREAAKERPFRMVGGMWLPGLTCIVFTALGIGVFFTDSTFDSWGAGILLLVALVGWALYVHFVVMPRKARIHAEEESKRQTRRSRRPPPRPAPAAAASEDGMAQPAAAGQSPADTQPAGTSEDPGA